MRRQIAPAVLGTALAVVAAASAPDAANTRTTVVVSDLHMGAGRDSTGAWLPSKDFRWSTEFGAFLESIGRSGATDLILNGDTFELLRSAIGPCSYADESLGCSEPDALERLNRVLAAHRTEIEAIGRFARQATNHVVFVPGDQDASLVFQSVARRLVAAVGAPSGRVDVVAAGYWRSADGRVYAEHGQQIGYSASVRGLAEAVRSARWARARRAAVG
jgi:hypothetical protein